MKSQGKASLVFVGCLLAAYFSSAAMAKSLSWKELVGKKICWDTTPFGPSISTYSQGGKYYNTLAGAGTITMTAKGFHVNAEKTSFDAQIEVLPDGRLKATEDFSGRIAESFGKYCK
jgi:hypothetical protein